MPLNSKKSNKIADTISKVGGLGIIKTPTAPAQPAPQATPTAQTSSSPGASTTIQPHQDVTFNKDKTVTITRNGQSNTISQTAYDISLQAQGGGSNSTSQSAPASEAQTQIQNNKQADAAIVNPVTIGMSPEQLAQIGATPQGYQDPLANQNAFGENALAAGSAIGAGVIGASVASGTAAGSIFPGAGNVIGAVAGLGVGLGKLSMSERQNVKNANKLFLVSKQNMATIINRANSGVISPSQAIIAFNQAKQDMLTAQRHLKAENQNLNKYLSGGYEEMVGVDTWVNQNLGLAEEDLRVALMAPNPTRYTNFNDPIENGS